MPIDFHDAANRTSYSWRVADDSWREAVRRLVDPPGADVVDVGCGGGIYTRAWHELGAATVTGVDFSEPMLEQARTGHGGLPWFGTVTTASVWEIRRRYADPEEFLAEIGRRAGRSILHELSDPDLSHLVDELRRRLPRGPVVERDRWTLWRAERAA